MKRILLTTAVGVMMTMLTVVNTAEPLLAQETETNTDVYLKLDLFTNIFNLIRNKYVEETDTGELVEAAINGMLASLDPHSHYLSPEASEDMMINNKGEFGGLGIEVTLEDGFVKVIAPMDETPADEAGIEAGDIITHVDGESILGLTLNESVDLMRGPVGSEIIITVVREGESEPFDVAIIRDTIKLTALKGRIEQDAIVLRVIKFNEQTYKSLENAIDEEIEAAGGLENVNGIVLDLRNNPGGLLDQAIKVTDAFLEKGEIVSTRPRNLDEGQRFNATPGDLSKGKPIVVLINGGSASASEIVAGALQDHRRAILVGTKTFGKGSVQSVMPIQGDGAITLTTSRYYTPSGRSIQALGVTPDIIVEQPRQNPDEDEETVERPFRSEADLRGRLDNDSLTQDEILQIEQDRERAEKIAELRKEDYQLAYAIDILKGLAALNTN